MVLHPGPDPTVNPNVDPDPNPTTQCDWMALQPDLNPDPRVKAPHQPDVTQWYYTLALIRTLLLTLTLTLTLTHG